jgi:hypothetical protein
MVTGFPQSELLEIVLNGAPPSSIKLTMALISSGSSDNILVLKRVILKEFVM